MTTNIIYSAFKLTRMSFRTRIKAYATLASLLLLTAAATVTSNAATFTVTNSGDSGAGSLRQAVIDANNTPGADLVQINVPFILLVSGELNVTEDLSVNGNASTSVTISGNTAHRIFRVSSANASLNLTYLNFFSGRATNASGQPNGGAIYSAGPLTVQNCSFVGNVAEAAGGAIFHTSTLVVNRSTFTQNNATTNGGALANDQPGANAILTNSTIGINTAVGQGGGIRVAPQTGYSIKNTIVAQNGSTGVGPDISGTVSSQGYNLFSDTAGLTINGVTTGNQLNVNPQLQTVAANNGATVTLALPRTSPAIDAGDPAVVIQTDQRGTVRGIDGNSDGIRGVDIGAFERAVSAFDFNGDETADLSVIRPVSINSIAGIQQPIDWYLQTGASTFNRVRFGLNDDVAVPADYDGDGRADVAVYRPSTGTWLIQGSTSGFYGIRWGIATDVPVPADYDGDGKADVAVFRAGTWYILNSQTGFTGAVSHGQPTDTAVPADYDGDGKADLAVYTGTHWNIIRSNSGLTSDNFGLSGDIPVQADYDGDGKANLAVFRPSDRTWYYARNTGVPAQNFEALPFGLATDKLVPADYDADGKTDIAIYRNGVWYINGTRKGLIISTFGLTNDSPVAGSFIP